MPDPNNIMMFSPDGSLKSIPADQYDVALKNNGERAILFHDPKGKEHWVRQKYISDALNTGGYVADQGVLVDPKTWPQEVAKQGRYKMSANGKTIPIPYSFVGSAAKAGYVMSPDDRKTYVRDAAADPNLGAGIVGRNSAGQPIFGEKPVAQTPFSSTFDVLKQGVTGVGKLLDPRMTPEEQERAAKSGPLARLYDNVLYLPERVVGAQVETGKEGISELRAANKVEPWTQMGPSKTAPEAAPLRLFGVTDTLGSLIPGIGPMIAQGYKKVVTQYGEGNPGGAAGTAIGTVALMEGPKYLRVPTTNLLSKAITSLPEGARGWMRGLAKADVTSEDMIEQFEKESNKVRDDNTKAVNKVRDDNTKADNEHHEQSFDAAQTTRGNELNYEQKIGSTAEELENKQKKAQETTDKFNQRVNDKHQAKVQEVNAANADVDRQIQEYQIKERQIADDTAKAFDADEQARLDTKKFENDKWAAWRTKAGMWRGIADPLVQAIEKAGINLAEVKRLLAQVKEDPGSVSPNSAYGLARQNVIDKLTIQGNSPGAFKYEDLPPGVRTLVDTQMQKLGIQPPSASLNLQQGGTVTLDELHRAKSVLRRHSIEMRRAGKTIESGEADQLADIFEDNEAQWSKDAGAFQEWMDARESTRDYNEAFGREFSDPRTHLSELEERTNPDFIKKQESEENVQKMEQRNPQLAAEHRRIREERERLDKMPNPEALEKKRQDVPPPPTVNDLRDGYRLKEPPKPIDAQTKAREKIEQPLRDLGPDRPKPGEAREIPLPDGTTVPRTTLKMIDRRLRDFGRSGQWVVRMIVGGGIEGVAHGHLSVFGGTMLMGQAGVSLLVDALRKPSVIEWLAKPNAKELKMIDQLKPEDAARLRQALTTLASDEISRNLAKMPDHFDPTVAKFLLGAGASQQKPTLDDLKKQVQKAKPQLPTPQPTVAAPAPRPQSSVTPQISHVYNELKGIIEPIANAG